MPRIEPIPYDEMPEEARARYEAGNAKGMHTKAVPIQVMAHSPIAWRGTDEAYKVYFKTGRHGARMQELIRLRSADLHGCAPCSTSRKDDAVGESDIACLGNPSADRFSRREVLALKLLDTMSTDLHSIDDDTVRELATEFDAEEIVELAYICGQMIGGHRFVHVLDVLGDGEPVVKYEAEAVRKSWERATV